MEEEDTHVFNYSDIFAFEPTRSVLSQPVSVCKCLLSAEQSQEEIISEHKKIIFSTVARTENYLRERRIPELIRYVLTKIIANGPCNPAEYTVELMDQCMLYRAGYGVAPVVYENRHLEAVVKSFDPGERGWLSARQVSRAFTTLGFTPKDTLDERIPIDIVLNNLRDTQERELFRLLTAGTLKEQDDSQAGSTTKF